MRRNNVARNRALGLVSRRVQDVRVRRTYNAFGESDEPFESDVSPGTMGSGDELAGEESKGDDPLNSWY